MFEESPGAPAAVLEAAISDGFTDDRRVDRELRGRGDRRAGEEGAAGGAGLVEAGRMLRVDRVVQRDRELIELAGIDRRAGLSVVVYASSRPLSCPPVSPASNRGRSR